MRWEPFAHPEPGTVDRLRVGVGGVDVADRHQRLGRGHVDDGVALVDQVHVTQVGRFWREHEPLGCTQHLFGGVGGQVAEERRSGIGVAVSDPVQKSNAATGVDGRSKSARSSRRVARGCARWRTRCR